MKKRIWALVLGSVAGVAHAQSSVTLYGTVDDGIQYANNVGGHYQVNMQNGALGSSKWGLLGTEDIGGKTTVIFRLEAGFDPNSGKPTTAGYEFNRQAYVGVDGPWGVLKMGRQYDISYTDGVGRLAAPVQVAGGLGTHAGDIDNLWGTFNIQNAVTYLTPKFGDVRLGGLYGFGNAAGALSTRQALNFIATFAQGPVSLAAGFMRINNPATAVWGGASDPVANTSFNNPLSNPITSGYASAHTLQIADAAGSYAFGRALVGLVVSQVSYQDVVKTSSTPFSGTAIFRTGELNASYQWTPAFNTGAAASYTYSDTAHYTQVDVGVKYLLSKRTQLYTVAAWQHAAGTNSLGKAAVANLSGLTASSTPNQVGARFGIRHNF